LLQKPLFHAASGTSSKKILKNFKKVLDKCNAVLYHVIKIKHRAKAKHPAEAVSDSTTLAAGTE
jgi:hypothetical protein